MNRRTHLLAAVLLAGLAGGALLAQRDRTQTPGPHPAARLDEARLTRKLQLLRNEHADGPLGRLSFITEAPFVVVSDLPADQLARWSAGTIRWAVTLLRKDFFPHDPDHVIAIWLLKDDGSYRQAATLLTGRPAKTPYGFYSPSRATMVMNIATGGGTLVHEIVHPLMKANFPACPAWFNEGLGSLYEQSAQRDGKIVGLTNWRLPILQNAIRRGKTIPLKQLTGMDDEAFYGPASDLHYAQARYLCYYLQQQGLLRPFYAAFRKNHHQDPTGYATLRAVLQETDMADFRKRWENYCMKLRFRR